jgi:hypothetical protein
VSRLYGEPTRFCKVRGLRREWNGSRSGERQAETSKHHEIRVERDPLQATDAKRGKAVLVLEPSELALDGNAIPVEVAEPL